MAQMLENYYYNDTPSQLVFEKDGKRKKNMNKFECNSILVFIILGFILFIFAIIELMTNYQENIYVFTLQPSNQQLVSQNKLVYFEQDQKVFVYLKIQSITQYDYTNQFDKDFEETETKKSIGCKNYKSNRQMGKVINIEGDMLQPQEQAIPCGYYPSLFPNANYTIYLNQNVELKLNASDLILSNDQVFNINPSKQWVDLTDMHYRNWMQANADMNTVKLLGSIEKGVQGHLKLIMQTNTSHYAQNSLIKIIVTDNKALGGYNFSSCFLNIFQSLTLFLCALLVYLYNKLTKSDQQQFQIIQTHQFELKSLTDSMNSTKI